VGVGAAQSVFVRHATHCPSGAHSLSTGCDAQSMLARHWTHDEVVVLHSGASPWHCAFEVHPARHVKSCGLQMGWAVPQSLLLRHWTHCPSGRRQRGASVGQSELTAHSTHCCVTVSQIFGPPAVHGLAASHPTQTPGGNDVSQMGAPGLQSAFDAHPAWQVWSPGQHEGVAGGQSLFCSHAAH
jgi:hypothetical protein